MTSTLRERLIESIPIAGGHAEIWRVFEEASLIVDTVEALADRWKAEAPTKIAGIEARGFILGASVARVLGVGFAGARKAGGFLPGDVVETRSGPDHSGRRHSFWIRRASIVPGDPVVLVDDWCETGAQALAVRELIERCSAEALVSASDLREA